MGCLGDDTIAQLIEGQLDAGELAAVHAHIDTCPACRALVADAARPADAPDAPLATGAMLGRYIVIDLRGAGAMGVVHEAWDPQLRRRIALKLLRPDREAGPSRAGRLVREAQAMARLQHPNVVAVHDVGQLGERVFVAMELVDGETLAGWLRTRRPWRELVAMFAQVGEGLAAAHAAELVHRDFKPDNVLVGEDGRPRVTDFGLAYAAQHADTAQHANAGDAADAVPAGALTETGALLGTPAYMAPEQMAGGAADARSDQFAFCLALYEALYGERPFAGDDLPALRRAIAAGELRRAPAATRVPARVRRVVLRGLAADPAARYPSMRALLAELSRARRSRGAMIALAAAPLVAIAVVASSVALHRDAPAPCSGLAAAWGDAWTDATRARVAAAFQHTGRATATAAVTAADRALSAYRASWIATSRQVCAATRVHGTQPEALFAVRAQCLDDRRRDAAALARVFADADGTVVDNAVKALAALEPIEPCAAMHANEIAAPADPERADALRGRLAEAKALEAAGRYTQARDVADAAAAEAHRIGALALEGQLLYRRGHIEWRTRAGDPETSLHAAALAAIAARDDGTAADAWTYLSFIVNGNGHRADAERWSSYAAAAIQRMGGDDLREAHRLHYLGFFLEDDVNRLDEAAAIAERAHALIVRAGAPDDLALENDKLRAGIDLQIGRYADALPLFRRAREVDEATVGSDHPGLSTALENEAVTLVLLGRAAEAVPIYERVIAIQAKAGGYGKDNDAWARLGLARAQRQLGDFASALADDQRAVALYDADPKPPGALGTALFGEGDDLLGLGRAREAIAPLERAVAACSGPDGDPEECASTSFALARALWDGGGDRARAVQLATAARTTLAPLAAKYGGEDAKRVAEATTWLASHPPPARGTGSGG